MSADARYQTHSLAEASPGEALEVRQILFEESRRRCAEAGVEVGTRARCRERTAERIHLDLADGRAVEIDGTLASFIEVHVLERSGAGDPPRVRRARRSHGVHLS